ncbi:MAG: hypothetical protein V4524_00690 [Patescibacteria group bacterium]
MENSSLESNNENIDPIKPFEREDAWKAVEQLTMEFGSYYSSLGYIEHQPVDISSGIDPSVRFIGSHISVLKPELIGGSIPAPGEYIVQDCMRAKNLKELFNDASSPQWGSTFTSMGALVPYERLDELVSETLIFFEKILNVKNEDIKISVSSQDQDLVSAIAKSLSSESLEVDMQPNSYYRHQIGVEGIIGRNFNLAIRNKVGGDFSDVGNIIVLEDTEKKLGAELALGSSVMLKQMYGLEHVNDCYPLTGIDIENKTIKRKFEDCIIVSISLFNEGLEPRAADNKGRILRSYVRALSYFRSKENMSLESLAEIMARFESKRYPDKKDSIVPSIVEYLRSYEEMLLSEKISTAEDKIIAAVLKK